MVTEEHNEHQMLIELQTTDRKNQELVENFKKEYCINKESPLTKTGCFSRLFFNWMIPKFKVISFEKSVIPKKNQRFKSQLFSNFLAGSKNCLPERLPLQPEAHRPRRDLLQRYQRAVERRIPKVVPAAWIGGISLAALQMHIQGLPQDFHPLYHPHYDHFQPRVPQRENRRDGH